MKMGMIGGIGPESTVDYYQQIITLCHGQMPDSGYPEIIISSINMTSMLKLLAENRLDELTEMLLSEIDLLADAGADFAFIASNTPHIVFNELCQVSPIPLVSIVEAVRRQAESMSLKKAGLLGTAFTMKSRLYQDEFDKSGIRVVVPKDREQDYIEEKLFTEIENGIFLEETREGLLRVIKRMLDEDLIDSVILGCTELPLILTSDEYGIPFLNTTKIHVSEIVSKYFSMNKA